MKVSLLFILILSFIMMKAQNQVFKLYEGQPKGSENWNWKEGETYSRGGSGNVLLYNVTEPSLTYFPANADPNVHTSTALIIAPGGGFQVLDWENEGLQLAEYFSRRGIAVFVLKYRLLKTNSNNPFIELGKIEHQAQTDKKAMNETFKNIIPLSTADGLNAIEFIRKNKEKFGVDADKIGMIGFSAGGILTLSVAQTAEENNRPNFIAPIYAEYSSVPGKVPSAETPVFVCAATDDTMGFAEESLLIYNAYRKAGHPAELHIYEKGKHGFGGKIQNLTTDTWIERFSDWLRQRGYLKVVQ